MNRRNVKKRTLAREFALKALYSHEIHENLDEKMLEALAHTEGLKAVPGFARQLIYGCLEHRDELDGIIQEVASNWRLNRMPNVDRNILRLGAFELIYCPETPPKVAINEAIELSKTYSTEDSPNFINGVLDKVYTGYAAAHRDEKDIPGGQPSETAGKVLPHSTPQIPSDPSKRADLHLHTTSSDGSLSPSAVVEEAGKRGMDGLSITDHDSIDGVEEALKAGRESGIIVVPGVEMSAYIHNAAGNEEYELHILGYFIDIHNPYLVSQLQRLRDIRIERVRIIADRLKDSGIEIDIEKIIRQRSSTVGRLHVALELIDIGVCKNVDDAFSRFLGSGEPAYVPKEKLTVRHTVDMIHRAGGCAVLAHPGFAPGVEQILEELISAGLDGVEVHYPGHNTKTEAFWMDTAGRKNLLITGGSDFHGNAAADVTLGQETVSFAELHEMAERAGKYRLQAAAPS